MNDLIVRKTVEINAPPAKVWDTLTNSEFTKQYMFGCELVSDLKVGSPILWRGASDAKIYVKGKIVSITPNKLLRFTTFDPNAVDKYEDIPSNYTTATYELSPREEGTLLSVTQGDYSKIVNGSKRYQDTVTGWDFVLPKIKELAEKEFASLSRNQ